MAFALIGPASVGVTLVLGAARPAARPPRQRESDDNQREHYPPEHGRLPLPLSRQHARQIFGAATTTRACLDSTALRRTTWLGSDFVQCPLMSRSTRPEDAHGACQLPPVRAGCCAGWRRHDLRPNRLPRTRRDGAWLRQLHPSVWRNDAPQLSERGAPCGSATGTGADRPSGFSHTHHTLLPNSVKSEGWVDQRKVTGSPSSV